MTLSWFVEDLLWLWQSSIRVNYLKLIKNWTNLRLDFNLFQTYSISSSPLFLGCNTSGVLTDSLGNLLVPPTLEIYKLQLLSSLHYEAAKSSVYLPSLLIAFFYLVSLLLALHPFKNWWMPQRENQFHFFVISFLQDLSPSNPRCVGSPKF